MPIGETLAQARRESGLTVTQVSRLTRIRETIIRNIEHDDYSECGGDFYARGHIRAIAKAVAADPEPLIHEYDEVHRAPGAMSTVSLDELLAASDQAAPRHRPDLPPAWARLTTGGPPAVRQARHVGPARHGGPDGQAGPGVQARSGDRARRRTAHWAALVGVALVVVLTGFVALRLLAGSPPAAAPAAAKHPAHRNHPARRHLRPAAKGSRRATAPSPATGTGHSAAPSPAVAPPQPLAPIQATAFGPNGGDNPQLAHLVLGGQRTAGWHTDWYSTSHFGNLYPGTGLLLDMGHPVTLTSAQVDLGNTTGASFQLRVGTAPALAALSPVAHTSGASGVVKLSLSKPARGRYVLVWFTKLPADPSGTFEAHVYSVSLQGHR